MSAPDPGHLVPTDHGREVTAMHTPTLPYNCDQECTTDGCTCDCDCC
jgi:hypothetical protein